MAMAERSPPVGGKGLSVVVPTYEEADNVVPLCTRLFAATRKAGLDAELLLVDDDSGAGTAATRALVERLQRDGYSIRLHVRQRHEGKGLSSAVLLGLRLATHDAMLVMDADLQHEPESAPAVAAPVLGGLAEFAVGSRNVSGGKVADGWPLARRVISNGATLLARPLTPCTDPMSGFFCLSRNTLRRAEEVRAVLSRLLSLAEGCPRRPCAGPVRRVHLAPAHPRWRPHLPSTLTRAPAPAPVRPAGAAQPDGVQDRPRAHGARKVQSGG
jgi:dolichol-phosphate mannosyltransferase